MLCVTAVVAMVMVASVVESVLSCKKKQQKIADTGTCNGNAVQQQCIDLCNGEAITSLEKCATEAPHCCVTDGKCVFKYSSSVVEGSSKSGIIEVKDIMMSFAFRATMFINKGPDMDGGESLDKRSLSVGLLSANETERRMMKEETNMRSRMINRMGGDAACVKFPLNCDLEVTNMDFDNMQPDIDVPYCRRTQCSPGNNALLDVNAIMCLSIPGCGFDLYLYYYRYYFGQAIMPNVPVCHKAIKNQKFLNLAVVFMLKYGQSGWNPAFTRCLIEDKKEEILSNPPGCEMVLMLENMGHVAKMAGWEGITSNECYLFGGCWLDNRRCMVAVNETGDVTVTSTKDYLALQQTSPLHTITARGAEMKFGLQECHTVTGLGLGLLDGHHNCLAAGCVSSVDANTLKWSLLNVGKMMLPEHLRSRYECMVRRGDVRADNYLKTVEELQAAGKIQPGQILGSLPLVHLDTKYVGLDLHKLVKSLELTKVGPVPDLACAVADSPGPPLVPPMPVLVQCPYAQTQLFDLPQLTGSTRGCCSSGTKCYFPSGTRMPRNLYMSGLASYLSEWTTWTPCSLSCGPGGHQLRTRVCVGRGPCVPGPLLESRMCTLAACSVLGPWSDFSPCPPCGPGLKVRKRACLSGVCPVTEALQQTEMCPVTVGACTGVTKKIGGFPRGRVRRKRVMNQ